MISASLFPACIDQIESEFTRSVRVCVCVCVSVCVCVCVCVSVCV